MRAVLEALLPRLGPAVVEVREAGLAAGGGARDASRGAALTCRRDGALPFEVAESCAQPGRLGLEEAVCSVCRPFLQSTSGKCCVKGGLPSSIEPVPRLCIPLTDGGVVPHEAYFAQFSKTVLT